MSRIVVKVGSNILAGKKSGLNLERVCAIASDLSKLIEAGHEVVMVSSGAVAAGMSKLGLKEKPEEICLKQAAAAAGQSSLIQAYEKCFGEYARKVAQLLLTRDDLSDRARYLNARNTLITLLEYGIIPIINENDTVATDEIKFGDNDHLAALVSGLIDADRLVILSDVDGLYSEDPKSSKAAKVIPFVDTITSELEGRAGGSGSAVGTGGMYSKVLAAKKAVSFGVRVNIINGRKKGLIVSLLSGKQYGTEFVPQDKKISSRKGWIAYAVKPKGSIVLDDGAVNALLKSGKSLLPSGISKVDGVFDTGDAVFCLSSSGRRIAKGIVNYSSLDIEKIKGRKTTEIEPVLGYKYSDEVIHRDNLVVLV